MKKLILFLLPVFLFQASFAQKIHYEKSFESALAKASAQNKLVFLEIFTPRPTINVPQNVNFTSGLEDEEATTKFNKNFINYRISITDTAVNQFKRKYQLTVFPAYLFLDKNNYLIYRDDKNSTLPKKYLDMAEAALKQVSSGKNLSDYDATYKKGKYDGAFLKEYISKREQLGIFNNAKLIDQYVEFLPIKALNDYETVLFILRAGPYAYGKTFNLAYTNRKIADSVYKKEPLEDRVAMNNRISGNTMNLAIATKDANMAQNAANFRRGTFGNDYRNAIISSTKYLFSYYLAIKDTARYLQQAMYFYDNNYMNISADSAKKFELAQRQSQLSAINSGRKIISADSMKKLMAKEGNKTVITREVFSTSSPALSVANELNNAAYSFYTSGTTNPNYLSKAIIWSRRSILFKPVYGYYDTLAHLLYRYGFYAEAEVNQNLAVDLAKKQAPEGQVEMMKKELEKIKKRTL